MGASVMRIAMVNDGSRSWLGLVDLATDSITELAVGDIRSQDPAVAFIKANIAGAPQDLVGEARPLSGLHLLSPIRQPSKNIICVGKNYRAHAAEFAGSGYDSSAASSDDAVPTAPILFSKGANCLIGALDDVCVPWRVTSEVDYEAELGVVIGRAARHVEAKDAFDHVWGYTVINDVTARDLQARHKQWLLGKSIDTFCPMGPYIVTADEVDPENLDLACWVNGELRQQANTKDLIFDIPTVIATASASMTLEPGDIIATGTPAGVGIGFKPPRFLQSGDVVKVHIKGVGTIENRIT